MGSTLRMRQSRTRGSRAGRSVAGRRSSPVTRWRGAQSIALGKTEARWRGAQSIALGKTEARWRGPQSIAVGKTEGALARTAEHRAREDRGRAGADRRASRSGRQRARWRRAQSIALGKTEARWRGPQSIAVRKTEGALAQSAEHRAREGPRRAGAQRRASPSFLRVGAAVASQAIVGCGFPVGIDNCVPHRSFSGAVGLDDPLLRTRGLRQRRFDPERTRGAGRRVASARRRPESP